eukprot:2882499-Prymnesium_polylepis.1
MQRAGRGVDLFKLPTEIRNAAFHGMLRFMKKFATYLFPDLDWPAQRKRMKCVINGIGMDSGLDAWKAKYGDSQRRSLVGNQVQLACSRLYSLESYQHTQRRGTTWMAAASPRML